MMTPIVLRSGSKCGVTLVLLISLAGLRGAHPQETPEVFTKELPDIDLRSEGGDVLDLDQARLSSIDRTKTGDEAFLKALVAAGDLAYDYARPRPAVLLIASGEYAVFSEDELLASGTAGFAEKARKRSRRRLHSLEVPELDGRKYLVIKTRSGGQTVVFVRHKSPAWITLSWVSGKGPPIEREKIEKLVGSRRKAEAEARGPDSFGSCTLKPLEGQSAIGFDFKSKAPVPFEKDPGEAPRAALRRRAAFINRVDLCYSPPHLRIASHQSASLGKSSLRAHLEKDLKTTRLQKVGLYHEPDLEVGAVFLLETLQGKLALIRIEAVTRQEVRLRWLLDGDDDGRFGAVEAYWRGEVEAPPAEKE
jgi:hypothetical protein